MTEILHGWLHRNPASCTNGGDEHGPWSELTVPCVYLIRLLPEPVVKHPAGHRVLRCEGCGGEIDLTAGLGDGEEGFRAQSSNP